MEQLKKCMIEKIDFDQKSIESVLSKFEEKHIKKGELFLKSGDLCKKMAFIEKGYLRMYDIVDGKEITLWIGSSDQFITSLSSFIFQTQNQWNIEALTDCTLYVIKREDHMALCKDNLKWLEFDNILLAQAFVTLERSMFLHLHSTAKERMNLLFEEQPKLFNEVPLQHIATMMGIAPESLSRLRKNQMERTS
ncbi:MAG: Crp/Fnr family transcriptional regulator [Ekhidna sp.]